MVTRNDSLWKTLDWVTIFIYLLLIVGGWFSVCGASYDYGERDFLDFSTRAGKQFVWIICSFGLGFVLLMLEDRMYDMFAYIIYVGMILLLIVTIFIAPDTKGSRSWLVMGPVSLQPAEFAKFATALALAKYMNSYSFSIKKEKCAFILGFIILLPMLLIIGQRETGSALVYLAFFLVLYREGMPGVVLFAEYVKVDGIIVLSGEAKNIPETGVPIIHYKERQTFNPRVDTFSSECKSAVGLAVEYLKESGHRDIAFIGELLTNIKLEYFLDAMREQGLKADDSFIRTSHSRCEEAGFSEMEKLLSLNRRPTAIMCAYDTIAFGAIDAIKQHGLRVPEDFSIIGMNDVRTAVYSGIGLTTVREVPDEVFSMMTDLLCKRMDGSNVPRQAVTVHGELIKRQSVAKR